MKDTFSNFFENASSMLREKAADAGQAAWDKTMQAIEKWLEEFPRLEAYGLRVSNFGFVVGISPALEVELQGEHSSFPVGAADGYSRRKQTHQYRYPSSRNGCRGCQTSTGFR
ncbi:MAG: hypothetical protein LH618_18260 [Saprospiraceae bacterium]|nr:hypothetical protein [Saprospiraceae bacterium]